MVEINSSLIYDGSKYGKQTVIKNEGKGFSVINLPGTTSYILCIEEPGVFTKVAEFQSAKDAGLFIKNFITFIDKLEQKDS